jgi:hypothetical protein
VTPSLPFVLQRTLVEGAEVRGTGVSVVDRGEPEEWCWEWHGDGTAGEYDLGTHLAALAPARAIGEAVLGHREPRWQAAGGGPNCMSRIVLTVSTVECCSIDLGSGMPDDVGRFLPDVRDAKGSLHCERRGLGYDYDEHTFAK